MDKLLNSACFKQLCSKTVEEKNNFDKLFSPIWGKNAELSKIIGHLKSVTAFFLFFL